MNFSCPACQAKYFVSDADVIGRTLKLCCHRCRGDIPIQGRRAGKRPTSSGPPRSISSDRLVLSLALPHVAASDGASPASVRPSLPPPLPADRSQGQFYIAIRGEAVGPLEADDLASRVERGEVGPRTYVWRPGEQAWQRLSQVAEFAYLLARVAVPPPNTPEVDPLGLDHPALDYPAQTLEERLGFGYLGEDPASSRRGAALPEKRVRLAARRRPEPSSGWASLFVGLVISLAVGVALGSML
jgi:predicted Zn finger-like uncharacterized protein